MSQPKVVASRIDDGLVVDSSIALAWCFADEQDEYSQSVLDAMTTKSIYVPDLWHLEVANTLLVGERRKRCTQMDNVIWLRFLSELPITVDEETKTHAFAETTHLARLYNLSVYDAAYLELAMRRGLSLATHDQKLKVAAKAVGVILYGLK